MYEKFFGCLERPFDLSPNPRYLVATAAHREALSTLEYGIASRKGITLLIGEAGSGKTTVIRAALERQPSRVHYVHLHNPALTREEFVEMLARRFNLSEKARGSKAALLLELEELLIERQEAGETTLLVIDEAQSLPTELLEEIRLLANIETNDQKLVSVIMAGQPELSTRLNDPSLRQFKQRVALRCELRPLAPQETLAYVAGRLRAAGGETQVFTREAVGVMHRRSKGIPRTISVIADNALLTAFALGQRLVTAEMVHEVCREFDIGEPRAGERAVYETVASPRLGTPVHATVVAEPSDTRLLAVEDARTSRPLPTTESPERDRPLFSGIFTKRRRFPFFFGRDETHG